MTPLPMMRSGPGWRPDHCRHEAVCIAVPAREEWPSAHCPGGCVQYEAVPLRERVEAVHAHPVSSMLGDIGIDDEPKPRVRTTCATGRAILGALANVTEAVTATDLRGMLPLGLTTIRSRLHELLGTGDVRRIGSVKIGARRHALWASA